MARILYGAPESEREENNNLVSKLRKKHNVEYLNDFLGFAGGLSRCKNSILLPQKYDLVIYDTKVYGENWHPDIRAEHFKFTIGPFFKKINTPVMVLADLEVKDKIKEKIEGVSLIYVPQPYSLDEVVQQVNSLLPD